MAKFQFIQWLITFLEDFENFIFEWDSGNSMKSEKKHGITTERIESCFFDIKILPLGVQTEPKTTEERYGVIAKDVEGKVLFICFTIRQKKIRPISARLANKRKRAIYEA